MADEKNSRRAVTSDHHILLGATFTIAKNANNHVDVFVFLSQRFLLAAGIMLPWTFLRRNRLNKKLLIHGSVPGLLLFASYAFQTVGLNYTSASNTGFLIALSVVLVPLFRRPLLSQAGRPQHQVGGGLRRDGGREASGAWVRP